MLGLMGFGMVLGCTSLGPQLESEGVGVVETEATPLPSAPPAQPDQDPTPHAAGRESVGVATVLPALEMPVPDVAASPPGPQEGAAPGRGRVTSDPPISQPQPGSAAPKPSAHALSMQTLGKVPFIESEVKEKVRYARMMFGLTPSKRVQASDMDAAKALLAQAIKKADEAQAKFEAGELRAADDLANESYALMGRAVVMVPGQATQRLEKARHPTRLKGLSHAKDLYRDSYRRMSSHKGRAALVAYDVEAVADLEAQASDLAGKGDYRQANQRLIKARQLVDIALMEMLENQVIVYEIDLSTPEKEFEYEWGRYQSYEELIPIAKEMKLPSKGQLMLIDRTVEKGQWMAQQARETAALGDYPNAIRMITDAAKQIRKALRIMGVETFE